MSRTTNTCDRCGGPEPGSGESHELDECVRDLSGRVRVADFALARALDRIEALEAFQRSMRAALNGDGGGA